MNETSLIWTTGQAMFLTLCRLYSRVRPRSGPRCEEASCSLRPSCSALLLSCTLPSRLKRKTNYVAFVEKHVTTYTTYTTLTCVFRFIKSKSCVIKGIFQYISSWRSLTSVIFWKKTTHNAAIELLVFCLLCRQKRCVSASFRVGTVCTCLFHCPTTITENNLIVSV